MQGQELNLQGRGYEPRLGPSLPAVPLPGIEPGGRASETRVRNPPEQGRYRCGLPAPSRTEATGFEAQGSEFRRDRERRIEAASADFTWNDGAGEHESPGVRAGLPWQSRSLARASSRCDPGVPSGI